MKRSLLRLFFAAIVASSVTLVPRVATASPSTVPVAVGVSGALLAGRSGTVYAFHVKDDRAAALEIDAASKRVLREFMLGSVAESARVVRATRVKDRVFVVVGITSGDDSEVVLFRLAPDLSVESREVIGHGTMPSIDGDAATGLVVTGFFEERLPISGPEGRVIVLAPPTNVLHVQTREAATSKLVGSRMFRGADGSLLSPHGVPARAAHAVAIHDGRVVLALPMRRACRIVTAKLPLLEPEGERSLEWPLEPAASFRLHHVAGGVVAIGRDRPDVVSVAGRPAPKPGFGSLVEASDDVVEAWGAIHRLEKNEDGAPVIVSTKP